MTTPGHVLWYRRPAVEWTEALPVGNGRLGAMVFGGVGQERLQINEDTLWSGGPYQPTNPEALPHLAEVRRLIFAGRYAEAEALANRHLMARPHLQMSYQPAGDLWLDFPHDTGEDYRRDLDLDRAVATTAYTVAGVRYWREVFVSPVDQVLVLRISADRAGAISATVRLTSEQAGETTVVAPDTLAFRGTSKSEHGVPAALQLRGSCAGVRRRRRSSRRRRCAQNRRCGFVAAHPRCGDQLPPLRRYGWGPGRGGRHASRRGGREAVR